MVVGQRSLQENQGQLQEDQEQLQKEYVPHLEKDLRQRRKIRRHGSERALDKEAMFPKDNIAGDTKVMRDRVKTPIPLLSFAIAKKTTKS